MSRQNGFTLLELAIVMTIAGILLMASGPAIGDLFLDMRRTRVLNDLLASEFTLPDTCGHARLRAWGAIAWSCTSST